MSSNLTWPTARELALNGTPVRREGWPAESNELAWIVAGRALWRALDRSYRELSVVQASDFTRDEFLAGDWTTDAIGTVRDVCSRPTQGYLFAPPGYRLTGEVAGGDLTLTLDLGDSAPAGRFGLRFEVNGAVVGYAEAGEPGRYTVVTTEWAYPIHAQVRIESRSPLPEWEGLAVWRLNDSTFDVEIDLLAEFPAVTRAHGALYGAKTFGPYSVDRWVYSPADNPAAADDDLVINGVVLYENGFADLINGGATTLLHYLPAGETFTVDIKNSPIYGGDCSGSGVLRLLRSAL